MLDVCEESGLISCIKIILKNICTIEFSTLEDLLWRL
jgi:hypothetical protein